MRKGTVNPGIPEQEWTPTERLCGRFGFFLFFLGAGVRMKIFERSFTQLHAGCYFIGAKHLRVFLKRIAK